MSDTLSADWVEVYIIFFSEMRHLAKERPFPLRRGAGRDEGNLCDVISDNFPPEPLVQGECDINPAQFSKRTGVYF